MNIVEQTPTKLTIKFFIPVYVWVLTGGITVILALLLLAILFMTSVPTFTCKRVEPTQGTCQLLKSGLFKSQVREIPLNTLKQAEFKSHERVGSRKTKDEEVVLLTKTGEKIVLWTNNNGISFSSNFSDDASLINAFLKNPNQKSLKLSMEPIGELLLFLILSFFFTIIFLGFSSPIVTCSFDKSLGLVVLKHKGFRGKKVREYLINNILKLTLEKHYSKNTFSYWVVLVLKRKKRVILISYSTDGPQMPEIAESISEFLNITLSCK